MYEEILTELKKRASARGEEMKFSVKQLRIQSSKNVLVTANKQHSQPQGSKDSKKTECLATGLSLYL